MDYDEAYECLGYIWYYGRTGERDYKKAFEYFSKMMDKGNLVAEYKVADMYKNGYYVDKDQNKYENMIKKDNIVFARLMDAGKLLKAKITQINQKGTFKQISVGIYLVDF